MTEFWVVARNCYLKSLLLKIKTNRQIGLEKKEGYFSQAEFEKV